MKKAISLILALTLVMGLSVSAFAADVAVEGDSNKDVTADFEKYTASDTGIIRAVKIEWNSVPQLKYSEGSDEYVWNADKQVYEVNKHVDASWSGGAFEVKVYNKSNTALTFTAEYTDNSEDGLTTEMKWTTQSVELASAAKSYTEAGKATEGTLSGTVVVTKGTITKASEGVGSITITIN